MGRLLLFPAALALAGFAQAPSGVDDPRAFLQGVYDQYRRGDAPTVDLDIHGGRRLRALARALDDVEGGEDRLDFNWWVNGQDRDLGGVRVSQIDAGANRRIILARFANFGRPQANRFLFARSRGRWFLDDVTNVDGRQIRMLSSLLRQALEDAARTRR